MNDQDKTKQQLIDEAAELRQSLDALINNLPEGFFIVDSPDKRLRLASRYGWEMIGVSKEELQGVRGLEHFRHYQVFHPDGTPAEVETLPLHRALCGGEVIRNEEWLFQVADGKKIPILCHAGPVRNEKAEITGAVISWQDITERKLAEEKVRQSERRFHSLFDDSAVAMVVITPDASSFLHLNPAFCEFLGYSEEELLGRTVESITYPGDISVSLKAIERAVSLGPRTQRFEKRYLHKNGRVLWGEVNYSLVRDAEGNPAYFIAQVVDITERKLAEEALQKAHDELERRVRERTAELAEANRRLQREVEERQQAQDALERERQSLWKMLQASDHERQTISYEIHDGIAQYLAAAMMQFQAHDSQKKNSPGKAQKAYETALELVHQAHSESRRLISEVRPPVIDESGLETAVSHLICEHRRNDGPKIECRTSLRHGRLPAIMENALYRIAQEALTNACIHSKSKKVKVALTQDKQDIRLEVRDWGIGFDGKSTGEGHFGLEGIRERARLLGGKLTIESTPGSGTLVQVVVPVLEMQAEE